MSVVHFSIHESIGVKVQSEVQITVGKKGNYREFGTLHVHSVPYDLNSRLVTLVVYLMSSSRWDMLVVYLMTSTPGWTSWQCTL